MASKFIVPNLENLKDILIDNQQQKELESKWIKCDSQNRPMSAPKETYADIVKKHNVSDGETLEPTPEWIEAFLNHNPHYEWKNGKLREKSHLYDPDLECEQKEVIMPPTANLYFDN